MDFSPGDRVVVVYDPDGLVVGWEGDVIRVGHTVRVWLDHDDMPSDWAEDELQLL